MRKNIVKIVKNQPLTELFVFVIDTYLKIILFTQ